MVVVFIFAIALTITMPVLHEQIAIRQIESFARRLIAHTHFARQQALHLGEPVVLEPILSKQWESGWIIASGCLGRDNKPQCQKKVWLSQAKTDQIVFRDG